MKGNPQTKLQPVLLIHLALDTSAALNLVKHESFAHTSCPVSDMRVSNVKARMKRAKKEGGVVCGGGKRRAEAANSRASKTVISFCEGNGRGRGNAPLSADRNTQPLVVCLCV